MIRRVVLTAVLVLTTAVPVPGTAVRGRAAPVTAAPVAAAAHVPVIVIDPGHSRTVHAVDRRTGLVVSDYENEPEMRDVFAVAVLVTRQLRRLGYRVVLTKTHVRQRRTLAQRAALADRVHADLALSIHDQAGRHGGVGFRAGNNIVYRQTVGAYRTTPQGHRVVFRDRRVAALSARYGKVFAAQRRHVERTSVRLQRTVGYDLGSRGLAPGNIWLVQLLSHVPWIYNEAGGNSRGRVGLNAHDRAVYAAALVASVTACLPLR